MLCLLYRLAFVAVGRAGRRCRSASTLPALVCCSSAGIGLEIGGFDLPHHRLGLVISVTQRRHLGRLAGPQFSASPDDLSCSTSHRAGPAVALGTITAEVHVPLLDSSIKSLQPVLRSTRLTYPQVLTEVLGAGRGVRSRLDAGRSVIVADVAATYRRLATVP